MLSRRGFLGVLGSVAVVGLDLPHLRLGDLVTDHSWDPVPRDFAAFVKFYGPQLPIEQDCVFEKALVGCAVRPVGSRLGEIVFFGGNIVWTRDLTSAQYVAKHDNLLKSIRAFCVEACKPGKILSRCLVRMDKDEWDEEYPVYDDVWRDVDYMKWLKPNQLSTLEAVLPFAAV